MKRQHKRRTSLFTTPNQQIDSSLKRASTALAAAFAASSSPPPPWQGIGYPPTAQHLLPASAKSPRRGKIFHSPLFHSATAHSTHQTGPKRDAALPQVHHRGRRSSWRREVPRTAAWTAAAVPRYVAPGFPPNNSLHSRIPFVQGKNQRPAQNFSHPPPAPRCSISPSRQP